MRRVLASIVFVHTSLTDDDITPAENANPVMTLRMRYDAWKKAHQ